MTYTHFSYLYDDLMKDVPYNQWLDFVMRRIKKYGNHSIHTILDLGCGTGELSIKLTGAGFQVSGVDLSEHMLAVANEKAKTHHADIHFYQQSMAELTGFEKIDCVVCFCDSLNYLKTEEEVLQTFKRTFESLKSGGLFMFDVHSIYKISQIFMNQSFVNNGEDVSYIWNCFPGEDPNSVEHDLSFFVKAPGRDHVYERFDEYHFQRTYPIVQYQKWLEEIGFTVLDISGDFQDTRPQNQCERVFFTAKK